LLVKFSIAPLQSSEGMHKLVSIFFVLICTTCTCLGRRANWRGGIVSTGPWTQIAVDGTVQARVEKQKRFVSVEHQHSRVGAASIDRGMIPSFVELHESYSTAQGAGLNPLRMLIAPAKHVAGPRVYGHSHTFATDSPSSSTPRPLTWRRWGGNHTISKRARYDRTSLMVANESHALQHQSDLRRNGWSNALLPGASSRPHPRVVRNDSVIMLCADAKFVHSLWYLEPPHTRHYHAVIGTIVRSLWRPDVAPPRVLILGLGGGVIAGSLLTHPARPVQSVCSVENDHRVIDIACKEFFPVMFAGKYAAFEQKHEVIHGDAFDVVDLIRNAHLGQFDFIVEDFCAYIHGGKAPTNFWNSLHKILKPGGTLIVNTHFEREKDLDALKSELSLAGWGDITDYVVPNTLQPFAGLLPRPRSSREPWKPRHNILITARSFRWTSV